MCVINHTYGFIFVHIPKNAGTSVARTLAALSTYRDLEVGATDLGEALAPQFKLRYGIGKHSTFREISKVVGSSNVANYRTFCVSRHPVSRARSMFFFLKRWNKWQTLPSFVQHAREFADCHTFDAFIRSALFTTPGPDRLFLPQTEWMVGDGGQEIRVDRVLDIDRLSVQLPDFLGSIGVPPARIHAMALPRVNSNTLEGEGLSLSEQSLDLLRRRYALDFDLLHYPLSE
jgi:Sulfotransferase family